MSRNRRSVGWRPGLASVALVAAFSALSIGISAPVFAATASSGSEVTPLIVGGQQATIADAPWQVALISASAATEFEGQFCGGSLIATQWVATAAHCVVDNGSISAASSIKILAGQATLSQVSNSRAVTVSNIYVHPLYSSSADHDDIALIKLTTPLALVAGSIQKIDLPSAAPTLGGPVLISGWGSVAFGTNNYPTILRKTTVDILADATCNASYSPGYDGTKMLCAGSAALDRDTCQGDSGGPLARFGDTWVLQGITSFGNGCANGADPGVYTEVYTYRSWISQYVTTSFTTAPNPTLSGTLTVGETISAAPGTWVPTPDSFTFVWKRASSATATSWTTISGQSGSSYQLASADRGQFIRVEVTPVKTGFTSPTPAPFAVSSAAVNAPFTAAPTPSIAVSGGGSATIGKTLTATAGTWSPSATLSYAWKRNGVPITNATTATYTLVAADVGQPISVAVTGSASTYLTTTKESVATANVAPGTFTTTPTPTILGSAVVDQTLSINLGVWAPTQDSFTYQWIVGESPVAAPLGTGPTYLVRTLDLGSRISVIVTAKKAGYDDTAKTSATTATVTLPVIATAPTPTISGTAKVANTLTAAPGSAPSGATVKSYQWSRGTTATGAFTDIGDATTSTYLLTGDDANKFLRVTVTWSKSGNSDTAKSATTATVAPGTFATPPVPTISGTVKVGETLTAVEGSWSPTQDSFAYVWQSSATATGTYAAISGATGKSYAVQPTDRGRFIKVVVTAVKAGYTSSAGTSAAPSAVVANFATAPTPTITVAGGAAAAVGKVLTATTGAWSPTSITTPSATSVAYTYVWKRNGAPIPSATAASYTLVAADLGQPITVAVTATLNTYVTTTKESAPTANVVKGAFATTPTPVITGTPITNQVLGITLGTWAPVQDSFTYQWTVGGTPVTDGTGVAATYTVKTADVGSTITVTVTAKKAGYEDTSKTSLASAPVTLPLIATAPTPSITPATALKVGAILTAVPGTAPAGATVMSYQWSSATTATGTYTNIPNASSSTYVLTGAEATRFIKVTVTWSKSGNADTPKLSAATSAIAAGTFATTATPTIAGLVRVGSTLTANEGAWTPTPDSFTYKWYISNTSSGTYTLISGATNPTYQVASGDLNKFLKVEIMAIKTGYTTSAAFRSAATAAVGPTLPQ